MFLLVSGRASWVVAQQPAEPAPPPPADADKKAEAKARFDRGVALMREGAWDAALAEFLVSRQLYPTRGNTQNAAVCLDHVHRFDEALDMFENLVSEFTSITPDERREIDAEMMTLRSRIGTIDVAITEPGAVITIDGRQRATTPVKAPIRVSAGSHVVRVYKEGFAPIERRVDVAGRQSTSVEGHLTALVESGRLKVVEENGKPAEVVVDNVVVGQAPWEGPLEVGNHAVLLRGPDNTGTQPASVPIRANQVTPLTLVIEPLESELRVQPSPVNAIVEIDGVEIGRGVWDGRVRAGQHRIEIAAEGFLPGRRSVSIAAHERSVVAVELERDTSSPLWHAANPPRFTGDAQAAFALTPSLGGDLTAGCSGSCSKGLGLGVLAKIRGGYELGSGIGFSIDLGYLFLNETLSGRTTTITPKGFGSDPGTANDRLRIQSFLVGASASVHTKGSWPVLVRVGGGVVLGALDDTRTGNFTTTIATAPPTPYEVGPLRESQRAIYAYVDPELRLARRLGPHVELGIAGEALVLYALSQPEWHDQTRPLAGHCGLGGDASCEGQATFGQQDLAGKVIVVFAPAIDLRVDF